MFDRPLKLHRERSIFIVGRLILVRRVFFSTFRCIQLTTRVIRLFFFFSSRRRHTRSLCDWSSDVCSSDLQLRATAAASFVLARNERSLLPLDRSGPDGSGLGRVALIGPNAEIARTLGGGSATVYPPYTVSPLDGLRAAGLDVAFAPGTLGHLRTAPARTPRLVRPDGSGGADVRFFSPSGEVIGSE